MTRTATPSTRPNAPERTQRPAAPPAEIHAPPRVRIAWLVSRSALLGDRHDGKADLMHLVLTLTPLGPAHARPEVRLTDTRGGALHTSIETPAPFNQRSLATSWIADPDADMLHIECRGVLAATFHAPHGDPHANSAHLLYVRSPLPTALGLAGGRYPLLSGTLERIKAQVQVVRQR